MSIDIQELLKQSDPTSIMNRVVAENCRRSLKYFIVKFWEAVEPSNEFVDGWWVDALCQHLEAVTEGRLNRLIVNCPPGFCKSLITNVFWPAWEWGPRKRPWTRYICAAYSQSLTERDNVRFMQVITHPLYQTLWGDVIGELIDNKVKTANTKTGWKLATSVGGVGTGERGDRIIIDDPNNVQDVDSVAIRRTTNRWLTEVMPTRLNNPVKSAIVVIQQRCHEEDATGVLLENEKVEWEHLCVPMRFDPNRKCMTSIGWEDPRTVDGELAWPERWPEHVVQRDEESLGPYAVAGQFQQLPMPRGGGIINVEQWRIWPPEDDGSHEGWQIKRDEQGNPVYDEEGRVVMEEVFPDFEFILVSVDTAMTEKESSDWSACTVWGIFHDKAGNPKIMLIEAWRDRLKLNGLVQRLIETCRRRSADVLLIEGKANGHDVATEVRRLMKDGEWSVILFNAKRADKVMRLQMVEPLFSGGLVYAPDRRWARMVIDEVASVPKGRYDDLADSTSQALIWMRKNNILYFPFEKPSEEEGEWRSPASKSSIAEMYGLA